MTKVERKYSAKLLLFGEHTVLKGSSSLAIPLARFYMQWKPKKGTHPDWLSDYIDFLNDHCTDFLDMAILNRWIKEKTMEANIPIGYGLGSSGALTAAIYDICNTVHVNDDLNELKNRLGLMESFFHGRSSGFDPLVSYCDAPILKNTDGVQKLEPTSIRTKLNCYLLDSGKPRIGSEMIQQFLENYNKYSDSMNLLAQCNNQIIDQFLIDSDKDADLSLMRKISMLQLEFMSYMIPNSVKPVWEKGLKDNLYYLKICGAGGGGYFLLFSENEISGTPEFQLEKVHLSSSS